MLFSPSQVDPLSLNQDPIVDQNDPHQQRKLSVRLTAEGVYFIVLMFSLLLIGINYAKPLMVVFTLFVANMALLSLWYNWRHMRSLEVFLLTQPELFVGKTVPLVIGIHDYCKGFSRDRNLEVRLAGEPQSDTVELINGLGQWAILYAPNQRGELDLGPVELTCFYPLGLFKARLTTCLPTQCVYPQPTKASSRNADLKEQAAETESMVDLRRYQQGDVVSRIHWSMYLQNKELMVKTELDAAATTHRKSRSRDVDAIDPRAEQAESQYWVDWNEFVEGDMERRLSQMTYSILKASRQGQPYGLRIPGREIPAAVGKQHRRQCLQALALYS